jgi:integrase
MVKLITSNEQAKRVVYKDKQITIPTDQKNLFLLVNEYSKSWLVRRSVNGQQRKEVIGYLENSQISRSDLINLKKAKELAQEKISVWMGLDDGNDVTINQAFEEFLRVGGFKNLRKQSTVKDYKSIWNQIPQWFKEIKTSQFKVDVLEKLIDDLSLKYERTNNKLNPRIHQIMKIVKGVNTIARSRYSVYEKCPVENLKGASYTSYEFYKEEKEISESIAKEFLKHSFKTSLKEPASRQYETETEAPFARHACASIYIVLILTGMRLNECRKLKWNEVDFIRDERNKLIGGILRISETRTKTSRNYEIAFGKTVANILMHFKRTNNVTSVFTNNGSKSVSERTIWRYSREFEELVNVRIKPRTLRTTFVSLAYKFGMQETYIAKQISHKTGNTVMHRNYLKLDDITRIEKIQEFEDIILEGVTYCNISNNSN